MTGWLLALIGQGWTPPGVAALVATFVVGAFVPVPRTALVLAAGLVFGMPALPLIVVASTTGSLGAFLLGRLLARRQARRWLERRRFTGALLRAFDIEGWPLVALLRFYGPMPSTVLNYAFAMTRIGVLPFTLATLLCSFPQTAVYCYLGSIGQQAIRGELSGLWSVAPAAVAIACLVTVMLLVGRRVRAILHATDGAFPPHPAAAVSTYAGRR